MSRVLWEVLVGNVGVVYHGYDEDDAHHAFAIYSQLVAAPSGRCAGEEVTLLCDGEIVTEYQPSNTA